MSIESGQGAKPFTLYVYRELNVIIYQNERAAATARWICRATKRHSSRRFGNSKSNEFYLSDGRRRIDVPSQSLLVGEIVKKNYVFYRWIK